MRIYSSKRNIKDSARDLVSEWAKMGYCELLDSPDDLIWINEPNSIRLKEANRIASSYDSYDDLCKDKYCGWWALTDNPWCIFVKKDSATKFKKSL